VDKGPVGGKSPSCCHMWAAGLHAFCHNTKEAACCGWCMHCNTCCQLVQLDASAPIIAADVTPVQLPLLAAHILSA
jgi:hypothetical protein